MNFAVALLMIAPAAGQPAPAQGAKMTGFVARTFNSVVGGEWEYVVFVPHDYDGTKAYPVILYLHGAGATKSYKFKEVRLPTEYGIGPAIRQQEKTFPFIVVFPRAEGYRAPDFTWGADSPNGRRALAILDEVMRTYKTDPERVYLTGLSMGGEGAWSLAAAHPGRWAAIVPICGQGNPQTAEKIKDVPCWCFHGEKDEDVKVEESRDMIAALRKAGGNPKYTEYPGVGHNSWDRAYATQELWAWLLGQTRE
jgi:predicted peptidase